VSLACLFAIFGFIAVFGNCVILLAIAKIPRLRSPSNWLLASLAAADLTVGIIINPIWIARCLVEQKPHSHPFKITIDYLWLQTSAVTTFTLCLVTVDRFIAVTYVFRYGSVVTLPRCQFAAGIVWLLSLLFASARLV
ncbi:predicted protein, partial [Nematostella vectensis]